MNALLLPLQWLLSWCTVYTSLKVPGSSLRGIQVKYRSLQKFVWITILCWSNTLKSGDWVRRYQFPNQVFDHQHTELQLGDFYPSSCFDQRSGTLDCMHGTPKWDPKQAVHQAVSSHGTSGIPEWFWRAEQWAGVGVPSYLMMKTTTASTWARKTVSFSLLGIRNWVVPFEFCCTPL